MLFADRIEAGRLLAEAIRAELGALERPLCLGIARGGVRVARAVAEVLHAELDVIVARKLGVPWQPELAVGAIAPDGIPVWDQALLDALRLTPADLQPLLAAERRELGRRISLYRQGRPLPALAGRDVCVIDDGLATGRTAEAVLAYLRRLGPGRLILAVPVAAPDSLADLAALYDRAVVLQRPVEFAAVGQFYLEFEQLSDGDVKDCLAGWP